MKNLYLFSLLFLSIITVSCNKDDDANSNENNENTPAAEAAFQATINGSTYSNYSFSLGVYQVTKGTNGNTLNIDVGDSNGEMITIFLHGSDGFSGGTVKEMGDIDSDNFTNFVLIRQQDPQTSYFSSSGSVTITNNREHPTESGQRLISGNFNITASTADGENSTSMTGSFTELSYTE